MIETGPLKAAVLAMLSLGAAICTSASDGRIPIGTAPYVITAPGSYYVTADLTSSGGTVITINSNSVSLDLNGHILVQSSTASSTAVIASGTFTNIKVFNGILQGGQFGVRFQSVPAGLITVEGLTITGFSGFGILISGASNWPGAVVTHNRLSNNGTGFNNAEGIYLADVWGGEVSYNTLVGAGTGGGGSNYGINLFPAAAIRVVDNTVTYFGEGIFVNSGCTAIKLRGNSSSYNYDGMLVTGSTNVDIEENLLSINGNAGLLFSPGAVTYVYRNNVATGNPTNYSTSGGSNGGGNL